MSEKLAASGGAGNPPEFEVEKGVMEAPEMPVYKIDQRTYQPQILFTLRPLTKDQRKQLRGALFILRMLEARVRAAGSIRKAAELLGVSKTFLSLVLRGKKPPGYLLVRQMGYIPVMLYKPIPFEELERVEETKAPRRVRERAARGARKREERRKELAQYHRDEVKLAKDVKPIVDTWEQYRDLE